jgi:TatD DNase family protein
MKYFDAHCHVNFVAFKNDMEAAIQRAKDAGVGMNVVGTQFDTSKSAVEVAEKYDNVWATVGLHPIHTAKSYHDEKEFGGEGKAFTSRGEIFDFSAYNNLLRSSQVVGIGECGLDYYRLEENTKKIQEKAFMQQIELANKLNKPLMLHIRASKGTDDAYEDALAILKSHAKVKGNSHFFAGSWEVAKQYLDFGITLSFTGVLTFTHDYDEIVKNAPLDMLLSETDAPYVSPVPHRGKRNEPAFVVEVVRAIARIKGEDEDVVRTQLMSNAQRVFNLPKI